MNVSKSVIEPKCTINKAKITSQTHCCYSTVLSKLNKHYIVCIHYTMTLPSEIHLHVRRFNGQANKLWLSHSLKALFLLGLQEDQEIFKGVIGNTSMGALCIDLTTRHYG